jgi:hypothetical protein
LNQNLKLRAETVIISSILVIFLLARDDETDALGLDVDTSHLPTKECCG